MSAAGRAATAFPTTLTWHRLDVRLRNVRWSPRVRAQPLIVLRALVLDLKDRELPIEPLFRLRSRRALQQPVRQDEILDVEFRFFGTTDALVAAWADRLRAHCDPGGASNFVVDAIAAPVVEGAAPFAGETPAGDEACLDFRTPFAFASRRRAGSLPFAAFREVLQRRLTSLLGKAPQLPESALIALDGFWRLDQSVQHAARSQPGHAYALTGCLGPYYLRGDIQAWWPWLRLAEVAQLGRRIGFGLGRFELSAPGPSALAGRFASTGALRSALEQVLDNHDDALAGMASTSASPFDAAAWCADLAAAIKDGRFMPEPNPVFDLPKEDGGTRRIERPPLASLVVARHLHDLLAEPLDRRFEPASLGFRKGHSRDEAARRIDAAIETGCRVVVEADIADFFPSIPLDPLLATLADVLPRADQTVVATISRLLHAPVQIGGRSVPRTCGLAEGSPLSPLLANLYLDGLDEWLAAHDASAVRYADDLLVLCRKPDEAQPLLDGMAAELARIGLQLKPAKTAIHAVADGFRFLGYTFPRNPADREAPLPLTLPLHVTEPYAFLGVHGDALEVRVNRMLREVVPLRRIDRILIHAPAAFSTALLRRCADRQTPIPIVFASGPHGRALGLEPDDPDYFAVAFRQTERYHAMSENERCTIAKAFVTAKIANSAAFLRQRYSAGDAELHACLARHRDDVEQAASVEAVRGHEGAAARRVFARMAGQINIAEFRFSGRERKRPDRFNALLNYGYYLLFLRLNLEVRGLGLNPYLGFLHRREQGERYESLVCDVQELFRAYVDRLLVRLVNLRAIGPDEMEEGENGYRLGREGMKKVALHFERELLRMLPGQRLTLGAAMTAQCLNLKAFLADGGSLICHRWSELP